MVVRFSICGVSALSINWKSKMPNCSVYQNPSTFNFFLSTALVVLIFLSYIPQHYTIINRKTSEGISPLFLILGSMSAVSALSNLVLVSTDARSCCSAELNVFECWSSLLGLLQVGAQCVGYCLILVLCVFATEESMLEAKTDYKKLSQAFKLFIGWSFLHITIIASLYSTHSAVLPVANLFGIVSSILGGIQYFPQIYTTYMLKHAGSLSIKMMLMQTPGGFIWTFSMMMQPNAQWSSWLPYLTAAVLQGVILIMCLYYRRSLPDEREHLEDILNENIEEYSRLAD